MAKLTKNQMAHLNRVWTERTAYGLVSLDRTHRTGITAATARRLGFTAMNGNASSSLVSKGLARVLTTTVRHTVTSYGKTNTFRVQVLVLTDAGRAAIGV